jgi:tetratricopeptide (TPR) repeat protein
MKAAEQSQGEKDMEGSRRSTRNDFEGEGAKIGSVAPSTGERLLAMVLDDEITRLRSRRTESDSTPADKLLSDAMKALRSGAEASAANQDLHDEVVRQWSKGIKLVEQLDSKSEEELRGAGTSRKSVGKLSAAVRYELLFEKILYEEAKPKDFDDCVAAIKKCGGPVVDQAEVLRQKADHQMASSGGGRTSATHSKPEDFAKAKEVLNESLRLLIRSTDKDSLHERALLLSDRAVTELVAGNADMAVKDLKFALKFDEEAGIKVRSISMLQRLNRALVQRDAPGDKEEAKNVALEAIKSEMKASAFFDGQVAKYRENHPQLKTESEAINALADDRCRKGKYEISDFKFLIGGEKPFSKGAYHQGAPYDNVDSKIPLKGPQMIDLINEN